MMGCGFMFFKFRPAEIYGIRKTLAHGVGGTQHVELESASSSAAAQVPPRVGRGSCTSGHRGLFLRLTVAGHAVRAVRRRADF